MHLVGMLRRLIYWNKVSRLWLPAPLGVWCQDGTGHDSCLLPGIGERAEIAVICHPVRQFIAIECLYLSE